MISLLYANHCWWHANCLAVDLAYHGYSRLTLQIKQHMSLTGALSLRPRGKQTIGPPTWPSRQNFTLVESEDSKFFFTRFQHHAYIICSPEHHCLWYEAVCLFEWFFLNFVIVALRQEHHRWASWAKKITKFLLYFNYISDEFCDGWFECRHARQYPSDSFAMVEISVGYLIAIITAVAIFICQALCSVMREGVRHWCHAFFKTASKLGFFNFCGRRDPLDKIKWL